MTRGKTKNKNVLRVIPLGGLDEIGKNMTGPRVRRRHGRRRRRAHVPRRRAPGRRPRPARLLLHPEAQAQAARHRHHARPRGPHRRAAVPAQGPRRSRPGPRHQAHLRPDRGQARRAQHQEAEAARGQAGHARDPRRVRLRLHRHQPLDPGLAGAAHPHAGRHRPAHRRLQVRPDADRRPRHRLRRADEGRQGRRAAPALRLDRRREPRLHASRARGRGPAPHHRGRAAARHRRVVLEPHPPRAAGLRRGRRRRPQGRRHRAAR